MSAIPELAFKWRQAIALFTAAVSLAGMLVGLSAAPAFADTPLARCQRGEKGEGEVTLSYAGKQRGSSYPPAESPANVLRPGDVVSVVVSSDTITADWGPRYGPDGDAQAAPAGFPVPGLRKYSSIARFNNNPGGWVGEWMQTTALTTCQVVPAVETRLLFGINDDNLSDNGGLWRITVRHYRADAPTAAPGSPLAICRTRGGGDSATVITQPGHGPGAAYPNVVDPPNVLNPGDAFTIDFWPDPASVGDGLYGPEGKLEAAPPGQGYPVPGLNKYSLLVRANNNPTGWIGDWRQATELGGCQGTPAVHARLLFAINDSILGDNTGHWTMTIRHYRATPVKASASAAMARCKSGDEGTVTFTGMLWWGAEGGLTLRPGDVYRVTVRGQMRIGPWPWDGKYTADGTGWSDLAPPGGTWPQPGLPKYGLLGSWRGLPNHYWLGANSLCIQWTGTDPVQVAFTLNDYYLNDNDGRWDIFIHKYLAQ
ncbi:hypothetical protein AB0F36_31500 [Streptomyces sp. NPDC029080]|uniref:hypothetical protein n=1 Tax=Streptomyces sp. NPDC029080 TaxID=3155017 RepID=UPI003403EC92